MLLLYCKTCYVGVKMLLLCFVYIFQSVLSDWVEITQNTKKPMELNLSTSTQATTTFKNFDYFVDEDRQGHSLNFLPFIEMIQDTLVTPENGNIKKKTLFLKNLRDNLLINIGLFLY